MSRILVAGIGNIFLGDDGFGVEVVARMAGLDLPEGVEVADFGIRGFDLAYALMDGYDAAVLVDAVARGEPPGTLYVIRPTAGDAAKGGPEPHAMDPRKVLNLVARFGGTPPALFLVACEPKSATEDDGIGLSAPVSAAIDRAVELVSSVVDRAISEHDAGNSPSHNMEVVG